MNILGCDIFIAEIYCRYDAVLKMNLKQRDMLQQVSDSITSMNDAIGSNPLDPVSLTVLLSPIHGNNISLLSKGRTDH